jgi:PAS domain S-box-containing protein
MKYAKLLLVFLSLFWMHIGLFSVDSLLNIVESLPEAEQMDVYYQIGEHYRQTDDEESVQYFHKALRLARKVNDLKAIAQNNYKLGFIYFSKSEYTKAIEYLTNAINDFTTLHDSVNIALAFNHMGNIYRDIDDYEKSLDYFLQALRVNEALGNKRQIAIVHNNIGNLYWSIEHYERGSEYYREAARMFEERGDYTEAAITYNNLANTYKRLGDNEKALHHYIQANQIAEAQDHKLLIALTRINIGWIYKDREQYDIAIDYYLDAINLFKELEEHNRLAQAYLNTGGLYLAMEDYETAGYYFESAYELALSIDSSPRLMQNCYNALSQLYFLTGDYQAAYENLHNYTEIRDSILSQDTVERIANLQESFELERVNQELEMIRRDNQIYKLEAERRRLENSRLILIVFFIGILLIVFVYFSVKNKKINIKLKQEINQKEKVQARLQRAHNELEYRVSERTKELADTNIKLQQEIENHKVTGEKLFHRYDFERLISTISTSFISTDSKDVNDKINMALRRLGEFTNVDRSYLFLFKDNYRIMYNSHEWCADGIEPQIDMLQVLDTAEFSWWLSELKQNGIIHIPEVNEMPDETESERNILQHQKVLSVIALAMEYDGEVIGFLGFDSVKSEKKWDKDDAALLKIAGEIFANAIVNERIRKDLMESEARFRSVYENNPDAIFIKDRSLHYSFVNPGTEKLFKLEAKEILGKNDNDLGIKDEFASFKTDLAALRGEIKSEEILFADRTYHVIKFPLRYEDATIFGICGIARDITERKKIEDAHRESEIKYRQLYESSRDGYVFINNLGYIVESNAAFRRMVGYNSTELKEMTYFDITPIKWHIMEEKIIREQILKRGYSDVYEKEYVKKDGSIIPIELRVYLVQTSKREMQGLWAFVRNISEKKEMQRQLLRAEYLSGLEQFAAGVAHEIKNPTAAVRSIAQYNRQNYSHIGKEFTDDMDMIIDTIDLVSSKIDLFSKFTKPASNKFVVADLISSIKNVTELVKNKCQSQNVKLRFSYEKNVPQVRIDEDNFKSILMNLIYNSLEAMPSGGEIEIKVNRENNKIKIEVVDTGEGMTEQQLNDAFRPFFTTKKTGDGMGLPLVYQYLKLHNADINIESEVSIGTRVIIDFPVNF